jgi:hypothetical protein
MSCPLYADFTRGCITKIEVIPDASFDFCDSDRYIECPFYRTVQNIGEICENVKKCPIYAHFQLGEFEEFLQMTKQFCLSENHVNCQRHRLKKEGKEVPKELLPDGRTIKLT